MHVKKYETGASLIPDAGDSIHMKALNYIKQHPDVGYRDAVIEILRSDAAQAKAYYNRTEEPKESTEGMIQARTYSQCRDELHSQTLELMVSRGIPYAQAFKEISSLPRNKLVFAKYIANSAKRIIGDEGD